MSVPPPCLHCVGHGRSTLSEVLHSIWLEPAVVRHRSGCAAACNKKCPMGHIDPGTCITSVVCPASFVETLGRTESHRCSSPCAPQLRCKATQPAGRGAPCAGDAGVIRAAAEQPVRAAAAAERGAARRRLPGPGQPRRGRRHRRPRPARHLLLRGQGAFTPLPQSSPLCA